MGDQHQSCRVAIDRMQEQVQQLITMVQELGEWQVESHRLHVQHKNVLSQLLADTVMTSNNYQIITQAIEQCTEITRSRGDVHEDRSSHETTRDDIVEDPSPPTLASASARKRVHFDTPGAATEGNVSDVDEYGFNDFVLNSAAIKQDKTVLRATFDQMDSHQFSQLTENGAVLFFPFIIEDLQAEFTAANPPTQALAFLLGSIERFPATVISWNSGSDCLKLVEKNVASGALDHIDLVRHILLFLTNHALD